MRKFVKACEMRKSNKSSVAERISPETGTLSPSEKLLVQRTIEYKGDVSKAVDEIHGHKATKRSRLKSNKERAIIGQEILNRPLVREYVNKALDTAGLGIDSLAQKLGKVVSAGTTRRALSKAKTSDGLKALRMAFQLMDSFPAMRIEAKSAHLEVKLQAHSPDEVKSLLVQIQEETQQFLEVSGQKSR